MNNPYDNRTTLSKDSKTQLKHLIKQAEQHLAEKLFSYDGVNARLTMRSGSMKITCNNNQDAIEGLITKLKKGLNHKAGTYQVKPLSILATTQFKIAIKEFIADKEYDNAIQYALLKNKLNDLLMADYLTSEQRQHINTLTNQQLLKEA